ncbi:unnamed protein product [Urochloa humidicola]
MQGRLIVMESGTFKLILQFTEYPNKPRKKNEGRHAVPLAVDSCHKLCRMQLNATVWLSVRCRLGSWCLRLLYCQPYLKFRAEVNLPKLTIEFVRWMRQ